MTVTQDATSNKYMPASGSEFTTFLTGSGIANPDLLWIMGQSSGASIDQIGSINGTVSGDFAGPTFHSAVSGWSSLGILFHNGNNDGCFSTDTGLPDLSASSIMAFMWGTIPNVAGRGLLSFGQLSGSHSVFVAQGGTTGHTVISLADASALTDSGTGLSDGAVHGLLLQYNHAGSALVLTTELSQYSCATNGSPSGKALNIANGAVVSGSGVAAGQIVLYLAAWFGSNAEITLAKQTALVSLFETGAAGGSTTPYSRGRAVNGGGVGGGGRGNIVNAMDRFKPRDRGALYA